MINLNIDALQLVKAILKEYIPDESVYLFGSRCTGQIKPYSDIDLAIITDKPISPLTMALLDNAFKESDLPYKVDIVDCSTIDQSFKNIIESRYEVIQ
jgi:predicted nucleotidyltransferase